MPLNTYLPTILFDGSHRGLGLTLSYNRSGVMMWFFIWNDWKLYNDIRWNGGYPQRYISIGPLRIIMESW